MRLIRTARRLARAASVATALSVLSALILVAPQAAHAGIRQTWYDFESPSNPGWWTWGGAGFDYNRGLAYNGVGNARVRYTAGWNAVNTVVSVPTNSDCWASAYIRTSDHVSAGFMTIRRWDGAPEEILREVQVLPWATGYMQYSFPFNSGNTSSVLFYVGMWGNGTDQWMQIDDVVIQCSTPF